MGEQAKKPHISAGLLAHVDAGKTTLSEALLYVSGTRRTYGRVDHKDAFTLRVKHENCTEIYPECYWLSITLEEGDGGLIRKRIARSWTERIIEE